MAYSAENSDVSSPAPATGGTLDTASAPIAAQTVARPVVALVGSCTSNLQVFPVAPKLGKMSSFHDQMRGQINDLRNTFL